MHDSVKGSATAGQRGRHSSENMFNYNGPYITSPDSVQVKAEAQDYAHQSTFPYEMAHGLPLTPSISAHGWQDQSIQGTTACYNTAVSAPDYSGLSYYQQQQYTDPTMVGTASMQYPVFTTSAQAQALYYHPGYSINQASHPEYAQIPSRRWPMTPQSHSGSPERTQHSNQSDNTWPSPALSSENPQSKERKGGRNANLASGRANLESLERSPSQETESVSSFEGGSYYGSVSPKVPAAETGPSRKKKSITRKESQAELDPDLCCPVCYKVFTRRSNCREHLKRHNPAHRQAHPCSSCGKTFGRKTDLKRHYLTRVHDGEKRFACELCGRHYSRLDTMHRHQKDGCPERKHKEKAEQHGTSVITYT